jgi:hypothetical protein
MSAFKKNWLLQLPLLLTAFSIPKPVADFTSSDKQAETL